MHLLYVIDGVRILLKMAGYSDVCACAIADRMPKFVDLVMNAISDGRDPEKELDAALDAIESAAMLVGEKKFPK